MLPFYRQFSCSSAAAGKAGRGSDWLRRHLADRYVQQAARDSYRARSAYKLLDIHRKTRLLRPGLAVVECGAAPGAWTQVAASRIGPDGLVISCDLLEMEPVPGALVLPRSDFTARSTQERILVALGERRLELVLSDMCPELSGSAQLDHDSITNLVYSVLKFTIRTATPGASMLVKSFYGSNHIKTLQDFDVCFSKVRTFKPKSSRAESAEIFIFGQDLKPLKAS